MRGSWRVSQVRWRRGEPGAGGREVARGGERRRPRLAYSGGLVVLACATVGAGFRGGVGRHPPFLYGGSGQGPDPDGWKPSGETNHWRVSIGETCDWRKDVRFGASFPEGVTRRRTQSARITRSLGWPGTGQQWPRPPHCASEGVRDAFFGDVHLVVRWHRGHLQSGT